jgi:phage-related protein
MKISSFQLCFIIDLMGVCLVTRIVLSTVVTLDSMKIYRTQECLNAKPAIYFSCKGENITVLPDVKQVNVSYTFEESWHVRVRLFYIEFLFFLY